jgi:hypothetical protein
MYRIGGMCVYIKTNTKDKERYYTANTYSFDIMQF